MAVKAETPLICKNCEFFKPVNLPEDLLEQIGITPDEKNLSERKMLGLNTYVYMTRLCGVPNDQKYINPTEDPVCINEVKFEPYKQKQQPKQEYPYQLDWNPDKYTNK